MKPITISPIRHCIMKPYEVLVIPCRPMVHIELTTDAIIDKVCEHYGVSRRSLTSNLRQQNCVTARYVAMHLIRVLLPKTKTVVIGQIFNRHYTIVVYASGVVNDRLRIERLYRNQYDLVFSELRALTYGKLTRIKPYAHA